jgi:hypothetical protein
MNPEAKLYEMGLLRFFLPERRMYYRISSCPLSELIHTTSKGFQRPSRASCDLIFEAKF